MQISSADLRKKVANLLKAIDTNKEFRWSSTNKNWNDAKGTQQT